MKQRSLLLVAAGLLGTLAAGSTVGCTSTIPNRVPLGEPFPPTEAEPLSAESRDDWISIPEDFAGAPLLILIGYVQDTQFDVDRWLFGVLDAELDVALREVPAARGTAARLASGFIDSGMRRGIPRAEWGAVTTTYGKRAEALARFTGTEKPRNARVLLLDANGIVRWFHDEGYSAASLIAMRDVYESQRNAAGAAR